ncbi:MAG TPA: GNAT family N-acetyltransferase [Anaerolineae bacterium]|nr:GNAT family N-acetyltransferase [Anaerolineae bacterium]
MVTEQPFLETDRLLLRPFSLSDAPIVQKLVGDEAIAATTLNIPHPYEDGMADEWIGSHQEGFEKGEAVIFAITLRDGNALIGAIGLEINQQHERAELGYWIGKPYWSKGYCTEAAEAVVRFGFDKYKMLRIHAAHFSNNKASGRVMEKIGMKHEGRLRNHIKKWGRFEDLEVYGILREEFKGA